MSESEPRTKFVLAEKQVALKSIRHEIRKKRLVFDEGKERFGMDDFTQLMKVKNTSEVKGYPFKVSKQSLVSAKGMQLALKIVPIETKYEKHEHPCHLEHIVLKELTDNMVCKGISPHITHYLGTQRVSNKSRALKQLNLKRLEVEGKIRTHSNMLISEFVEGGSLDNWIFNTYENDKDISDQQWKSLVFQLIYTISALQHHYRMMHNDFHYGNILIDDSLKPGGYFVYEIGGKKYYVKNTGVIPKLWDFEFSMVYSDKMPDGYPNKFITGSYKYDSDKHVTVVSEGVDFDDDEFNVPYNFNKVYDLHYFLTSLLDLYISQELFDWIVDLYPDELIPEDEDSTDSGLSESNTESNRTTNEPSLSDTNDHADSVASESHPDSHDDSHTESSYASTKRYLNDGRLINGVENDFVLPSPGQLLDHKFFESFTKVPDDFKESEAIYFHAKF